MSIRALSLRGRGWDAQRLGDRLFGIRKVWDSSLTLPLARCVNLGKLFKISDSISSSVKWDAVLKVKRNAGKVPNTVLRAQIGGTYYEY